MNAHPSRNAPPQRWLILFSVCLAGLIMPLSFTGPAVALTAIAKDLGGGLVALSWVTNAFMLTFGCSLMLAGALADRFGRKRVFICGLAALALSALLMSAAQDIMSFDAIRALQGISAAAALAGGTASLAQVFNGPERSKAFSLLGTTFGIGLAFGPLLAGTLTQLFGWRALFLCLALLSAIALFSGQRDMPESRDPAASRLDWPGAIVFTLALSLLTYAVLLAPDSGWSSAQVIRPLTGALLFMLAFILIERRTARPMLDLSLFRYPRFVGVQLLAGAPAYSYVVLLVLLPLRFIGIEGYSTVETGMMMLTLSAPMLALPLLTGAFAHRFSAGAVSSLGLLICAAGLAWLAHYAPGQSLARLLLPMLTIGCGISLPWGLMDGLAVSVVPRERAGMATGIFSTVRVAGEGIALAIVGALLALLVGRHLAPPTANAAGAHALAMGDMPRATALLNADAARLKHAYELAFQNLLYLLALTTLASAVIIFLFLRHPAREPPSSAPRITDAP
ncbi:TPA: MFS transporter [Serratia marcescens]|nr:MFS transporter [Serratia marcescens]